MSAIITNTRGIVLKSKWLECFKHNNTIIGRKKRGTALSRVPVPLHCWQTCSLLYSVHNQRRQSCLKTGGCNVVGPGLKAGRSWVLKVHQTEARYSAGLGVFNHSPH